MLKSGVRQSDSGKQGAATENHTDPDVQLISIKLKERQRLYLVSMADPNPECPKLKNLRGQMPFATNDDMEKVLRVPSSAQDLMSPDDQGKMDCHRNPPL